MPFLTGPALYLIIALLCTNAFTAVMWYVKSSDANRYKSEVVAVQAKHDAFVDQVKAQGRIAEEKAKAIMAEQKQITERVANDYQDRLARMRADYDRMRKQYTRADSGGVSVFPVAPATVDEIPADALPLAEQAAETTLMLIELQEWIRQVQ